MTQRKFWLPFSKRGRRRPPRRADSSDDVFKAFVQTLTRMQAHARHGADGAAACPGKADAPA